MNRLFLFFDSVFPSWRQFLKFGIVGVSNTAVSLAVYYGIVLLCDLHGGWGLQAANLVSFVVSVLNAYFWNYVWVFRKETRERSASAKRRMPLKFISAYFCTYILSSLLLSLWVDVLHLNRFVAPVLSLFITVPLNFLLNKLWIFRQPK